MSPFHLLIIAASTYYVFFVSRVLFGLARLSKPAGNGSEPTISVAIAARNEEANIRACLRSVLKQEYPRDRLTVFVVDDGSTDTTADIVSTAALSDKRVRLLSLPAGAESGIGRKPEAIRMAVGRSTSELIVTTDADCVHSPLWLRTMAATFDPATAMVAGPVVFNEGTTVFSRIERLDFLGLVVSGAGLIGAGRPIICNGANLAYRRTTYMAAQDQVQRSSNDDGTLMSRIVTRHLGAVRFASDPEAVVRTSGQGDILSFFRQRRRWAAVRGRFLDPTIYLEFVGLFLFFAVLLIASVRGLWNSDWLMPALWMWSVKVVVDWISISKATKAWRLRFRVIDLVAAEFFHPFSIVISAISSLGIPFTWKGRRLER